MKKTLKSATVFLLTAIFLLLPFLPYAEAAMTYDEMLAYVLESNLKLCNYKDGEIDYDYLAQPYEGDEYAALNEKAREITASCETNYEKAYEINKWVADNVYYDDDYYYHGKPLQSQVAADVFEKRVTVCAGYASLMTAMCRAAGVPSRLVIGILLRGTYEHQIEMVENNEFDHVWVEVYIDGEWNMCDPTLDSLNSYEYGEKNYYPCTDYCFKQSTEEFSKKHYIGYYYAVIKDYWVEIGVDGIGNIQYIGTAEKIVLNENEGYYDYAFQGNETIKEVTLSESMTRIPNGLFEGCKNLETVNFGKNIKTIGDLSFANCTALKTIYIPGELETIGYSPFDNCISLKRIYYGETKSQWDSIAKGEGNSILDSGKIFLITSDHSHTFSETITKEANCKEFGEKELLCEACGFKKMEKIENGSHIFTSSIIKEATCKEEGKAVYTCSLCGAEKTDVIAKTAHRDINGDLLCDFCGESITKNCSCMCHKDGFYGFIYKIVRFFWKLFGTNKECSCGAKHY